MKKVFLGFLVLLIIIPITLYSVKNNVPGKLFNKTGTKVGVQNNSKTKENMLFGFPANMDFAKAKDASGDLGKNALFYDYNPHGLSGSEWVYTKKVNSDSEYKTAVSEFVNYYNLKVKDGWTNEINVDGHTIQSIAADSPLGRLYGFIRELNGNIQQVLVYHQKDSTKYPANVQFRVFLSDSTPLGEVVK